MISCGTYPFGAPASATRRSPDENVMKAWPRLLYLLCFIALAVVSALALNRVFQPSVATTLVRAVIVAALCGAPGLVFRRLWPLAILLLPVGCYLFLRTTLPIPTLIDGIGGQFHFYAEQLRLGPSAYTHATFSLGHLSGTDAPELRLFFAFVVYWLIGAAAFLALSLRRALLGMALVLVLFGFSLTVDDPYQALWPAIAFLILAACLFVLSRALGREGWRFRDALAGMAVGVVASLLALGLLTAVPSVVATPWQDWRSWDPFRSGASAYSFNWLQNYPKLLDPSNNILVMRVESPSPSYWRASALDTFTGSAWVTSRAFLVRMEPEPQQESDGSYSYTYGIPAAEPTPSGETVTESFDIQSVYTNYFFTGGDPKSLTIGQEIPLRMSDVRALRVSTTLGPTLHYTLTAVVPQLSPSDLVGLGTEYSEDLDGYLTLPFTRVADIAGPDKAAAWRAMTSTNGPDLTEWAGLYDLNQRIVGDASDPYEITLRIERHLRQSYTYSLAPPASQYSSPYAAFVFDTRSGYCQHFAGVMAMLLRYNGIPARVAVGFATGETKSPGVYLVSRNNAHAWVEAYFPTVGWVAFDPTPGRSLPIAGGSSTSPGFVNPFADGDISGGGTPDTLPRPDGTPNQGQTGGETGDTGGRSWLSRAAWLPWVAALAVVLVGWPVGRGLWRRRWLHRGSLDQRLQASLRLFRTELSDYGVPVAPSDTLEEALQTLQKHTAFKPDAAFINRTDAVLFGGRSARTKDVEESETLRRRVKISMRNRQGWLRTGLAWYGIRRSRLPRASGLQYRDEQ
jgi:transglutaminase-like putative cysteine protease